MDLSYNYVIFNTPEGRRFRVDEDEYYYICSKDLVGSNGFIVVPHPLYDRSVLLQMAYKIHNSPKINQLVRLPFKEKWFPIYYKGNFPDDRPICFVIMNPHLPIDYLKFLKKKYSNCKIVRLHRDLRAVGERMSPGLSDSGILDLEMTIDYGESIKYNWPHFCEFESKIEIKEQRPFECDLFFAGKAKDRIPLLMEIYQRAVKAGFKVYYYLVGVKSEEQIDLPGIVYADKFMSYREMLTHSVNCKCMLEVNQRGADGYTSRFLEAVMYNKKLITNNSYVKQSSFYRPDYIQCFDSAKEIDLNFINNVTPIDYHYNNEFSPFRVIDRIEEELAKQNER